MTEETLTPSAHRVIDTPEGLAEAAELLSQGHGPVAVDVERASGFRYSQRAYLIQVFRRDGGLHLIDPPAVGDLSALQRAIGDEEWVLKPHIREMVKFRQLNLLDGVGHLGQFDLILCRNVLIYFDAGTRLSVLSDIRASLKRDGVLMLGTAETPPAEAAGLKLLDGVMGGYISSAAY